MSPRDLAQDLPPELAPSPVPRRVPATWLLTLLMGLGPFSMQILIPSLPLLAGIFAVPYASAQMTLTVYLVGIALGQLIYGPLSDRFGRRPVLLLGLAVYVLGSLAAFLAPTIGWLALARAAQAAGGCAGMVLTRAIVRDVFPRDQAASKIGFVMMGMTVAPMLAPLLGAELTALFGWRSTMLACTLFGLSLFILALRLPETLAVPQPLPGLTGMAQAYLQLARIRSFRCYAAITTCTTGVFFAFMAGAPKVLMDGLGHTPRSYALAFMAISFAFGAGSFIAGRYSARLGLARMLKIGLVVSTAGAVLGVAGQALLPLSLLVFYLPMTVVALGNGVSQPNAVTAAVSVKPQLAGTASGLVGALQMGFGAVMTLVTGALETGSGVPTAATMAGCAIGAQIALRQVGRAQQQRN
ncbi:Bcr/CflA family drug resistance efflux transporter [Pseudoroseomonas deserti]|uniref:Bcr/CflA family efflux transporter n=1 Tax=Teichococcus deserti TaxID=1817963 RepID=A0A1V2GWQ3_9PROT|nr:multidrug effflux MFS transporter [Pseudoroseomonas deserti]ONG44791.1 Bcr/CflA family drug resistance efflux transporter [Pseudoroseomonas deserti]